LIVAIAIPAIFLIVRSLQQGVDLQQLANEDQNAIMRLLGVDGIFVLLIAQNAIFVLIPLLRVALLRRESLATIGLRLDDPIRQIGIGFGLGTVVLICNALIGAAFQAVDIRQNQAAQYPLFAGDYIGQVIFFLGAALIVPIGEEVLFRGYIFHSLEGIWGERRWGQVAVYGLSALLFSLAHSLAATEGLIGLLIPAFIMGLLLAWGVRYTKSIVTSIIAHAMNNSVALIALVAITNGWVPNPN
jgi:membrane protease YdiL (CAAX protease family)